MLFRCPKMGVPQVTMDLNTKMNIKKEQMVYFGIIGVPILGKLHMFVQHAAHQVIRYSEPILCLASPAPSAALPLSR